MEKLGIIVTSLHIFICIILIFIVLLQTGKGADMGAVFGSSSSQTVFGSSGPGTFLGKVTAIVATVFMLTSLWLAYFGAHKISSIMGDTSKPAIEQTIPAEGSDQATVPPDTGNSIDTNENGNS